MAVLEERVDSAIGAEEGRGADPAERPSITLGEQLFFCRYTEIRWYRC